MANPWVLPQPAPQEASAEQPPRASGEAGDGSGQFPIGSAAGWRPDPVIEGQLRLWDGKHWTQHVRTHDPVVAAAVAAPPIRSNESLRAWALMAQLTLGLWIAVSAIAMLWQIATLNTLQVWSLQPGEPHDTEARSILQTAILIVIAQLLVFVVNLVFLFVWIGVARNDRYMNRSLLRGSTWGTIVGWLVPFVRVHVTWRSLTDLWAGSDPQRAKLGPGSASRAIPPLVLTYVILRFFPTWVVALAVARTREALGTVDLLRDWIFALIVTTAILIAANVCLIVIITRITDQLRGRGTAPGTIAVSPISASFTRA